MTTMNVKMFHSFIFFKTLCGNIKADTADGIFRLLQFSLYKVLPLASPLSDNQFHEEAALPA